MQRKDLWLLPILIFILTSCGSGKLFGPTITPSPTSTQTFTPTFTSTPSVTPSPTLTPTPTITLIPTVDYNQVFFDPQSEADFRKVIEAPPLDDPNRSTWEDNLLTVVDAKLPDYQGPFIESAAGGGFDPGNGNFEFHDTIVQPIASYKYFWTAPDGTEETIITKIFPIRDTASGKKGTISITYPPPGTDGEILPFSTWFGDFGEYGTATVKAPLYLVTGRAGLGAGGMLFSNEFLPADNTMGLYYLREFCIGKGIDPNLAKQHYVFAGY